MKTLKEKDKQSFLARKEEVYSLIMEMGRGVVGGSQSGKESTP